MFWFTRNKVPGRTDLLAKDDRIVQALSDAAGPLSRRALREAARVRAATPGKVLAELIEEARVREVHGGYVWVASSAPQPLP